MKPAIVSLIAALIALSLSAGSPRQADAAHNGFKVDPVLAVPSNLTNPGYVPHISAFLTNFQSWLGDRTFRGETFHWRPIRVISLPDTWEHYCGFANGYNWTLGQQTCDLDHNEVMGDLAPSLGYHPIADSSFSRHTVIWMIGGGAFAGGASQHILSDYNPSGGPGWAVLGDFNLILLANHSLPFGWGWLGQNCANMPHLQNACSQSSQRGAAGHEMLHGWRVPHCEEIPPNCTSPSLSSPWWPAYPWVVLEAQSPWWEKHTVSDISFTSVNNQAPVNNLSAINCYASIPNSLTVYWQNSGDSLNGHYVDIAPITFNNFYSGNYQSLQISPGSTSAFFSGLAPGWWFVREFEDGPGVNANHSFANGYAANSHYGGLYWVPSSC